MMNVGWKDFLLSLKGRVARKPFNLFYLAAFVILLIAGAVDYAVFGLAAFEDGAVQPVSTAMNLLILWPSLALIVKRLHDINYRGWWLVAGVFAPTIIAVVSSVVLIGYLVAMGQRSETLPGLMIIVTCVTFISMSAMIVFLIILSVRKGTVGPNRFGDDPLQNLSNDKISVSEGV